MKKHVTALLCLICIQWGLAGCASSPQHRYAASGTVGEITPGKDGYMATLHGDDGQEYLTVMSMLNLKDRYLQLKPGDKVRVSGDTIHMGNQINIQVQDFTFR